MSLQVLSALWSLTKTRTLHTANLELKKIRAQSEFLRKFPIKGSLAYLKFLGRKFWTLVGIFEVLLTSHTKHCTQLQNAFKYRNFQYLTRIHNNGQNCVGSIYSSPPSHLIALTPPPPPNTHQEHYMLSSQAPLSPSLCASSD